MINMDDPRHGRLRRIVSRGFTPRMLGALEDDVQRRAGAIIDAVIEKGECDFVTDIAAPLPLRIICDMMGIPESQHDFVFEQHQRHPRRRRPGVRARTTWTALPGSC